MFERVCFTKMRIFVKNFAHTYNYLTLRIKN